jgi:hypothetical protein
MDWLHRSMTEKMVMNWVTYILCLLFVCLMSVQMFFVCRNHFPQFISFSIGSFKREKRVSINFLSNMKADSC